MNCFSKAVRRSRSGALFFVFFCFSDLFGEVGILSERSLTISKHAVLDSFFRMLFEESQGGYVLYGNKPVCMEGILPKEDNLFMLGGDLHKRSVILKEGLHLWQTLPQSKEQQRYAIQSYDTLSYGWKEIVLINRKALADSVGDNLSLFQYVLGPGVDAETLFQNFTNSNLGFSSTLKNDKVLTGIVLGFGTQNSLHVGRTETLSESLCKKEIFPFKSLNERECELVLRGSSIKEELTDLEKDLLVSNELVKKAAPPIPWFGCLKNQQTKKLLRGYVGTQRKIQRVLKSRNFLRDVFQQFSEEEKQTKQIVNALEIGVLEFKNIDWTPLIAQSIVQGVPYQDEAWFDSFIQGMHTQDKESILFSQKEWNEVLDSFQDAEWHLNALENLIESDRIFKELSSRSDLTCVVPQKLYFYKTGQGYGKTLESSEASVRLKFTFSKYSGELVSDVESVVDLSDCIPGFVAGLRGMKIGEEREIFIHPALAYGDSYNVAPNMTLVARVKLLDIISQSDAGEFVLNELDLCSVFQPNVDVQTIHQQLKERIALQLGARTWAHFKSSQNEGYSLQSVTEAIQRARVNGVELSPEETDLLTHLHWKIYHKS